MNNNLLGLLRHHVSGAIARGEGEAIVEKRAVSFTQEIAYHTAQREEFRRRARASRQLGRRSEMFDNLRAAAYCGACIRKAAAWVQS